MVWGALTAAIVRLFALVIASKDAQMAECKETIKYQRSVIDHALHTAGRATDMAAKGDG